MNCSQFGQVVHDMDRAGALHEPLRAEALGHADECAHCGLLLSQVRTLDADLRALANEERGAHAPARLEAALKTIFRQRRAMEVHARAWRRWAWAGAAAVIVAAVVTSLTLRRDNQPSASVPENPPAAQSQPVQTVQKQEAIDSPANRMPAQDSETDSAEGFVPLPDSLPLLPAEEASVVRVRLQRGSLSAFGLLINEERAADLIQVDFLISEDGTPRAVRYVR